MKMTHMLKLAVPALALALLPTGADAQVNAGEQKPEASLPFTMTQVATFNLPWRIAFLPDGRMLITEKVGPLWLVTQEGAKTPVANVPAVLSSGPGRHARRVPVAELRDRPQRLPDVFGAGRRRARASRWRAPGSSIGQDTASLDGLQVIWREMPKGRGGQFGAAIAFSPDGQYLFLTVGDRQRMTPAQDPDSGARQDPAPDARRQTGARQSDGRQDRRGDAST